MNIQYFGLSSFKISTKEAVIITDPFDKKSGLTPPRGNADILILTEDSNPLYTAISGIGGNPFIIANPGEYDTKNVTVTGLPIKHDSGYRTVFLMQNEDISLLNLGHIKNFSLKEDEVAELGDIDVLIVPVGGHSVLDASSASKIVHQIQPKIVIPSHYQTSGLTIEADTVNQFIKELGGKNETMDKLTLKKKDLAGEETRVVILESLR